MEEKDKDVMRKMHVKLVRELDTSGLLLDYLYQENILSEEDVEKIKAKKTTKKKAEKLLKILKKRRRGLRMLIKALILTKIQDFLGYEILNKVTWNEEEKKSFEQELDDQSDEQQKLKTELEAAKREIQQLRMMLKDQTEKLQRNESRGSNFFLNLFRRSQQRQTKISNNESLHSTPLNGRVSLQDSIDKSPLPDSFADPFEVSIGLQSINSASVWDPLANSRRSSTGQSTSSAPVPWEMRHKRRSSSRTGSVVSSASLRIRNAFPSMRGNQDVDGYSNLGNLI